MTILWLNVDRMLTSCELSSGPFLLRTRSQFEIQTYVYRVYFNIVKLDSVKGQKTKENKQVERIMSVVRHLGKIPEGGGGGSFSFSEMT